MENLHSSSVAGGGMDPTLASPSSHLLVNLQTVAGFFTTSQPVCDAIVWVLSAAAIVWALNASARLSPEARCWLLPGLLAIIVLLGSYHRYYDLQLLLLGRRASSKSAGHPRAHFSCRHLAGLWMPLQTIAGVILKHPTPGIALNPAQWAFDSSHFAVTRSP